jgi:hypothetical protein
MPSARCVTRSVGAVHPPTAEASRFRTGSCGADGDPRRAARRGGGPRRLPRRLGSQVLDEAPPPRPARHPAPTWAQARPALPHPPDPARRVESSPTGNTNGSSDGSPSATRTARSSSSGTPANACGRSPRQHPGRGSQDRRAAPRDPAQLPRPEVARVGRTPRQWRTQILAYLTTGGVSNGGTEAVNLVIENTRSLAHGFRHFPTTATDPARRRRRPARPRSPSPGLNPKSPQSGLARRAPRRDPMGLNRRHHSGEPQIAISPWRDPDPEPRSGDD